MVPACQTPSSHDARPVGQSWMLLSTMPMSDWRARRCSAKGPVPGLGRRRKSDGNSCFNDRARSPGCVLAVGVPARALYTGQTLTGSCPFLTMTTGDDDRTRAVHLCTSGKLGARVWAARCFPDSVVGWFQAAAAPLRGLPSMMIGILRSPRRISLGVQYPSVECSLR